MTVTFLCVKARIGGTFDLAGRIGNRPILEIVIRMPSVSIVVFKSRSLHDEAHGELPMRQAGQDLKRVQGGRRALLEELEVKYAILVGINVLEDALVGDIGSESVGADV